MQKEDDFLCSVKHLTALNNCQVHCPGAGTLSPASPASSFFALLFGAQRVRCYTYFLRWDCLDLTDVGLIALPQGV
jgi:hypothetical protein